MARVLTARGVAAERLVLDEASRDTLQSAAAVARHVRANGLAGCVVCSDGYHQPRIRLLLALLGVRSEAAPTRSGARGAGRAQRIRMGLREVAAVPYDGVLALVQRRRLLSEAPPAPAPELANDEDATI